MITTEIHTQMGPGEVRPRMPVLRYQSGFYLTGTLFALNNVGSVRTINLRERPLLIRDEDVSDILTTLGTVRLVTIQEGMSTTTGVLTQLPWQLASGLGLGYQRRVTDEVEYKGEIIITHEVLSLAYLHELGIVPTGTGKATPGSQYLDDFLKEYKTS